MKRLRDQLREAGRRYLEKHVQTEKTKQEGTSHVPSHVHHVEPSPFLTDILQRNYYSPESGDMVFDPLFNTPLMWDGNGWITRLQEQAIEFLGEGSNVDAIIKFGKYKGDKVTDLASNSAGASYLRHVFLRDLSSWSRYRRMKQLVKFWLQQHNGRT